MGTLMYEEVSMPLTLIRINVIYEEKGEIYEEKKVFSNSKTI